MGGRVGLVPARLTHVGVIASRLRECDRIECIALGRLPKEALRIGLRTSLKPLTVLVDDRPEAMLGVMPLSLMRGSGLVWMLGTEAMYRQKRALVSLGPDVLAWISDGMRDLSNIVAADNVRAIRFLRHLGFHVGGPVQQHGGVAFVPFRRREAIQALQPAL